MSHPQAELYLLILIQNIKTLKDPYPCTIWDVFWFFSGICMISKALLFGCCRRKVAMVVLKDSSRLSISENFEFACCLSVYGFLEDFGYRNSHWGGDDR